MFPSNLVISQQWFVKDIDFISFYLPLLIIMAILSGIVLFILHLWKSNKKLFKIFLLFLLWFIFGLSLHLQIIPLDLTVTGRWFYFPIIGLLGMLIVIGSITRFKNIIITTFIFMIVVYGVVTIIRNLDWRDNITLYSHDQKLNQNSFILENLLGVEYANIGKIEEAEYHLEKSVELAPNWWSNWNNLGYVYAMGLDNSRAEKSFQKAIDNSNKLPPGSKKNSVQLIYYSHMARLVLYGYKDFSKAANFLDKAVLLFPESAELWKMKSLAEYKLGNQQNALKSAARLIELDQTYDNNLFYSAIEQKKDIELK